MKLWRNRSDNATCTCCGLKISCGEVCVKIETLYFYHGARSCYLHIHCIDDFCRDLKQLKKKNALKYISWKLR